MGLGNRAYEESPGVLPCMASVSAERLPGGQTGQRLGGADLEFAASPDLVTAKYNGWYLGEEQTASAKEFLSAMAERS